jgi:hypothetical protein
MKAADRGRAALCLLHLAFGAHQTVKASYTTAGGEKKTSGGVSVAGQDYLVLSLGKAAGKSSSSFILILHRQRGE